MKINKLNSLVELYFDKCKTVNPDKAFLKWLKLESQLIAGKILKREYLNSHQKLNLLSKEIDALFYLKIDLTG